MFDMFPEIEIEVGDAVEFEWMGVKGIGVVKDISTMKYHNEGKPFFKLEVRGRDTSCKGHHFTWKDDETKEFILGREHLKKTPPRAPVS